MMYDVAIVGGGPAGLTAAIEIAERGGKVIIIDDHPDVGGKLNGQLHEEPSNNGWWIGQKIASELKVKAVAKGIEILSRTQVWSLEEGWKIYISSTNDPTNRENSIESRALILATGAIEKPLPMPGWTLPGVLTVGGAQMLTNQYQVKPGKRVIVAGIGILSFSIARAMKLGGADVIGIYMAPRNEFTAILSEPVKLLKFFQPVAKFAPNLLMRIGGGFLRSNLGCKLTATFYPKNGLKVWGIPLHFRHALLEIQGDGEVESVLLTKIDVEGHPVGKPFKEKVDAVCLSGGLTPQNELAVAVGCQFVRLNGLSGAVPLHNFEMRTKVKSLYVAGNITGIEGAKVSAAQGKVAGLSVCKDLSIGEVTKNDIGLGVQQLNNVRENADILFHPDIIGARIQLQTIWEQQSN